MNHKVLFLFLTFFFLQCRSQKLSDLNFKYGRLFYEDSIIVESYLYDSATGLYEYKKNSFGLGKDETGMVTIKLTERELNDVYNLYQSLKPKCLNEYVFNENKLFYKSYITFTSNKNKLLSKKCTTNKEQNKYDQIEVKVLELIMSSYEYKRAFDSEFIKK